MNRKFALSHSPLDGKRTNQRSSRTVRDVWPLRIVARGRKLLDLLCQRLALVPEPVDPLHLCKPGYLYFRRSYLCLGCFTRPLSASIAAFVTLPFSSKLTF